MDKTCGRMLLPARYTRPVAAHGVGIARRLCAGARRNVFRVLFGTVCSADKDIDEYKQREHPMCENESECERAPLHRPSAHGLRADPRRRCAQSYAGRCAHARSSFGLARSRRAQGVGGSFAP